MIARIWHGVTGFLRFCWRAYLWLMVIEACLCGVGWLAGSLREGHPMNGDEFYRFIDSLPVIGGK